MRLAGEDLFRSGMADGADRHLEVQAFARQRMVQVDQDVALADLAHGDRIALSARRSRIEAQAGLELDVGWKERARKREDVVVPAVAVRVLAGDAERGLLA